MSSILKTVEEVPKDKKVVVFDLDGTLTESKTDMDSETASLLAQLLVDHKVGVIGGGSFERLKVQVLDRLSQNSFQIGRAHV